MLILSDHAKKHLEDIKRYLSKFNDPIDPLSNEVLTFLERVKGIPQTPNLHLGESERWRIVLHFRSFTEQELRAPVAVEDEVIYKELRNA